MHYPPLAEVALKKPEVENIRNLKKIVIALVVFWAPKLRTANDEFKLDNRD